MNLKNRSFAILKLFKSFKQILFLSLLYPQIFINLKNNY